MRKLAIYVPGKPIEEVQRELGVTRIVKLASNENPLGSSPRALAASRRPSRPAPLPGRRRVRAAPRARRRATRVDHRPGHPRQRLVRDHRDARPRLRRGRRRGVISQQSFVMYEIADRPGQRQWPIAVPARPDRGHDLDGDGRGGHRAHQAHLHRQPLQPDRHLQHPRRAGPRCSPRSATTSSWCSTRPTWSTSTSPTTRTVSPTSRPVTTSSSCSTFSKIYGLAGLRIGYGIAARPR